VSREKEGYRENLEILNTRFPNVDMLSQEQVMQVIGCTDRRTLRRRIPKNWIGNRISKVFLARYMCG
jgi:hypothetical protein